MAGVEGSTPRRVTVPLEFTLAVKERGRAQLEERRTSAAISGKVAAMVSRSGWGGVDLSRCVKPSSGCREGWGSGGDGRGGGSEGSDRCRGSLSGFVFGGGGHLRVGAARANGIEVSWDKLGMRE